MLSLKQEFDQALEARRAGARRCGTNEDSRLLERARYRLSRKGKRAICPKCSNGRRDDFTVSVNNRLYYCHRCLKGGRVESLRPAFEFGQLKARIRRADVKKAAFREWLSGQMTAMANRERRMERKARLASKAIELGVGWPIYGWAWLLLADWYAAKPHL